VFNKRLRWSRCKCAGFWYPSSRVQTRPKPSDFSGEKILSAPSFGGEVKPSVPCRNLRHAKDPKSDVEVATFGKILGNFSPIVPPSAAGVRSRHFRRGGRLVAGVGTFWSLVLQVAGLTCRWLRHYVKIFLLRILNHSWASQNPQGLQCRLKKKKKSHNFLVIFLQETLFFQMRVTRVISVLLGNNFFLFDEMSAFSIWA